MSRSSPPPANKRVAARSSATIDAPPDPISTDDSPLPGPATTTVRPPKPSMFAGKLGAVGRGAKVVLGAAVVVSASLAVAWGARHYLRTSPRFSVRTVLVDGVRRRTADEVARAGGVTPGKNIFALDLTAAGAKIGQDPWIERATVTRKLPSTVSVVVIEREAAALASVAGELYLVTREGDLFKKLGDGDPSDLPVITGISAQQVAGDRAGVVLAAKRAIDVAAEIDRSGVGKRWPIQEIALERDGSMIVTIGREAIQLVLGRPPYRDKIAESARVLSEVSKRRANASVVFLDNDTHPERVVVRMR